MKTLFALSLISMLGLGAEKAAGSKTAEPYAEAYFSGGCFWCIEAEFEKLPGIKEAISGYSGGDLQNPTYNQVARGQTGHREAVKVIYNPKEITYTQLLEAF